MKRRDNATRVFIVALMLIPFIGHGTTVADEIQISVHTKLPAAQRDIGTGENYCQIGGDMVVHTLCPMVGRGG